MTEAEASRFQCLKCGQVYRVRNADLSKAYSCKKCSVPLNAMPEANETVANAPAPVNAARRAQAEALTVVEPLLLKGAAGEPSPAPAPLGQGGGNNQNSLPALKALADDELKLEGGLSATAQGPDLKKLLPETFDGYRIEKELARGGMGAVMLGQQSELRRKVAIKIMLPWANDAGAQERFVREARAMAKLKHPHIVQVYDVGSVSGMPYLAMEFIEGLTLSQCIHETAPQERLSIPQMTAIVSKTGRALAFAHSKGVIHRDIKPANIMLRGAAGEPVIMDFGLAKDVDSQSVKLSVTGNVMGTPSYMSPEQAQGLTVDRRSDIYSLGAVLYEMLTRQAPFDGKTTMATIYNVVNNDAKPAHEVDPTIPLSLSRICAKALEKDPDVRYQSMDELAGDLDRFEAGFEVGARGPGATRKARGWARENRGIVGGICVGVAALILVIAGIQLGFLRRGQSKADELRASLSNGTAETRLLQVKALASALKDGSIPRESPQYGDSLAALRAAVGDKDPSGAITAAAATELGELRDVESEAILAAQLDVNRPDVVRRAAITAIGKLGTGGASAYAMKLIKSDPLLSVKLAAVEALPETVNPNVMVALIELSLKAEPPVLASAVTQKLGQLRPAKSVLSYYMGGGTLNAAARAGELVRQRNEYGRELEEALNEINAPASTKPKPRMPQPFEIAAQKLTSANRDERLQAAFDLGLLADARAEEALRGALKDADGDVALAAAESLGKIGALTAPGKISELLLDPSPATRRAAARACGLIRPPASGAAVADALSLEKIGPIQAEMCTALGRLKYGGGVGALLSVLANGNAAAQRQAAKALGRIGDKSAAPALVNALGRAQNDAELREEIAAALTEITGKTFGTDEAKWREALRQ